MKKILMIMIVLTITLLCAIDIKLPDEIITGNVNLPPDSIEIHKDLTPYMSTQKEELFRYSPVLNDSLIKPVVENKQKQGYLKGYLGTHYKTGLKMIWQNPEKSFLNAQINLLHHTLRKDWNYNSFSLQWNDKTLSGKTLSNPGAEYQTDLYNMDDYMNNFMFLGVQTDISLNNLVKFQNPINLSLSLGQYQFKSDNALFKDKSLTDMDLKVQTSFSLPKYLNSNQIKIALLKKQFSAHYQSDLSSYTSKFVESSAIHLLYSKYLIPSFSFFKSFKPEDNVIIVLNNKPLVSDYHRYQQIKKNPNSEIDRWRYQIQAPLNSELSFNWYTTLPVHARYNISYLMGQPLDVNMLNGHYSYQSCNALKQTISASTEFSVYDFDLTASTNFNHSITNEELIEVIPYIPSFETNLVINRYYYKIYHQMEMRSLIGRRKTVNNKMKDVFLMDYTAEYPWKYDIKFFGKIENMLNQKYQAFSGYPYEGINMILGLNWEF